MPEITSSIGSREVGENGSMPGAMGRLMRGWCSLILRTTSSVSRTDRIAISDAAARISDLIRSGDLTAPVPGLGRWKVRDVAAHLGGVHRWATRIVTSRSMDGPSFTKAKLDGRELCDWFDEGVEQLLAAFEVNPLDDPCPNFSPGSEKTVRWWARRQTHETTVHRWDIERALGCTTPISPVIAVDGIDEFLDVFVRTRGKQQLRAPLVLATTKPAKVWTLTPAGRPGRVDVTPGRIAGVTTEIGGSPEDVLLLLWGRHPLTDVDLEVRGDVDVAASLITPK